MKRVTIITDGACLDNPGPGGWAYILKHPDGTTLSASGHEANTTNNRMEMRAAIQGLRALTETCQVTVITDSQYLRLGITKWIKKWYRNNWTTSGKKPVLNQDLWQELLDLSGKHYISWEWVKGHSGHTDNEACDQLATRAATHPPKSPTPLLPPKLEGTNS